MRTPDVELGLDDLRAVTRFATACASGVLAAFEDVAPGDDRPRRALEAAADFVDGGRRTHDLRVTAVAAHRASKAVADERAHHAAMAAGDAAASAYLHPLADATQVGHVLRPPAHAARVRELGGAPTELILDEVEALADDHLRDVLAHYPRARSGRSEVARLVTALDERLRA